MNLLLFLSAILTALTGAMSGGRVADVQVQASYGAQARAAAASVATAPVPAVRHWLTLAGDWAPVADTLPTTTAIGAPRAAAPIYLDKPRE